MTSLTRNPIIILVLFVLVFLLFFSAVQYASAAPVEKKVLVLHPYSAEYPAHQAFNAGLTEEFAKNPRYKIKYSYEYLDMQKFNNNEAYLKATAEYLNLKEIHSNWTPDVIITSDGVADFLTKYGNDMFSNVPVVMVWAAGGNPPANLPPNYAVLPAPTDFENNIRLIIDTQKNVRKIYVVLGASDSEKVALGQFKPAAAAYTGQVEFVYLNDLPYEKMLNALGQAGDDCAVLFVRWVSDVNGEAFVPLQLLDTILKEVNIPVYGTQMQYLGSGIIGGYLYSLSFIGQNAADIVTRLFNGDKPENLTMTTIMANGYAFDWRALKRWNMSENRLPSGSAIAYKEEDFWDLYKTYIIVCVMLILLETALIIGLITNRRERRKAESNLLYLNDSLEKLVDERTSELQTAKDMLEELNRQLDLTARVDALTGLYNRRHMEERLKEESEVFKRTRQDFSVMLADIDDFKQINDVYGHDAGDSVLKTVSNIICKSVRDYDVVSRWGGEELLLLFPNLAKTDATERAETIRATVEAYEYTYNGNVLHVTLTIGVASFGEYDTTDSVIKRADNAMYQGKNSGRNKVVTA